MFPNSLSNQPPKEVLDLVNEYKSNPTTRELVLQDGYFVLYAKTITKVKDQPDKVELGEFIRRAYWADAGNMTLEMVKARLRL